MLTNVATGPTWEARKGVGVDSIRLIRSRNLQNRRDRRDISIEISRLSRDIPGWEKRLRSRLKANVYLARIIRIPAKKVGYNDIS